MKTIINKTFQLSESIEKVWGYMSSPTEIVSCVPGATLTEEIDERNYKGEVVAKFGPVKASYSGNIHFNELDETSYTMKLKGSGLDSKGKGSADMLMTGNLNKKDGGTEVVLSMEISIIGTIAQFGSRMIKDVSDQLLSEFIVNFKNLLAEDGNQESSSNTVNKKENTVNAFVLLWVIIKGFFRRLFGRDK